MRVLDLFSGIGGFSLGLQRAGMQTVAFCEIDPFCRRVLAKHWPGVPIYEDVRTAQFPDADIIVGGFPCQDVSRAGKRAGITGERSGLYRELMRAICLVRPRHAIMENVAALRDNGLDVVLGDMAESGFDAEWDCVPAQACGACHERDRIWIVTHSDGVREQQPEGRFSDIGGRSGDSAEARIADAESIGRGQGRTWRPADSFARVRNEARRNTADPYGARLAFGAGFTRDACEEFQAAQRNDVENGAQSVWPDEPALCGVDDGVPDWAHRIRALGNSLVPQIPEMIGRAILAAEAAP